MAMKPYTVYLYHTNGIQVLDNHDAHSHSLLTMHGEQPFHTIKVYASSGVGAVRAALMALAMQQRDGYMVPTGSQLDLTLSRMAQAASQQAEGAQVTHHDIIVRAVNTYAMLRDASEDGYVYTQSRHQGKLVVKRIALP